MNNSRVAKRHTHPIGQWLKENGKQQIWLADRLRISYPHLCQILSGQRMPSLGLAAKIEAITGIPCAVIAKTRNTRVA